MFIRITIYSYNILIFNCSISYLISLRKRDFVAEMLFVDESSFSRNLLKSSLFHSHSKYNNLRGIFFRIHESRPDFLIASYHGALLINFSLKWTSSQRDKRRYCRYKRVDEKNTQRHRRCLCFISRVCHVKLT